MSAPTAPTGTRQILAGPHIATMINHDGRPFVMIEPLRFIPIVRKYDAYPYAFHAVARDVQRLRTPVEAS